MKFLAALASLVMFAIYSIVALHEFVGLGELCEVYPQVKTSGLVTSHVWRGTEDKQQKYPVVRWQNPAGQVQEFVSHVGSKQSSLPEVGHRVEVYYDKTNWNLASMQNYCSWRQRLDLPRKITYPLFFSFLGLIGFSYLSYRSER